MGRALYSGLVELPEDGRTIPVDKLVITWSDRYLNVLVVVYTLLEKDREMWKETSQSNQMQHRWTSRDFRRRPRRGYAACFRMLYAPLIMHHALTWMQWKCTACTNSQT